MFKVFVSYSTNDLADVDVLRTSLEGSGIEVFVAEQSVKPSAKLAEEISAAIKGCHLFVLVWSESARNSEWVSQEIGIAHSLHKIILPIVLSEGMKLPGFIGELKYIQCRPDKKQALSEARARILEAYEVHKRSIQAMQVQEEQRKQKKKEDLSLLALGGLALWLFSK